MKKIKLILSRVTFFICSILFKFSPKSNNQIPNQTNLFRRFSQWKAAELHQSLNELPRDCPICIAKGTSFKSSTCSACKEKQVISSHFWRFFHSKHLRRSVTVAAVVPVPRLSAIGVWVKPPWAQFIRCGASDAGESGQTRADGRDGHVNFKHRRRICRAQGLGV